MHTSLYRETLKCIPVESGCASKRASHIHQNKHGLDVDEVVVPPSVCLYNQN